MTALEMVSRMHVHKRWANRTLFDAVAELDEQQQRRDFAIGCGSAWATLVHLWAVDLTWIGTLRGREDVPLLTTAAVRSMEELDGAWASCDVQWIDFLAGLDEDDLERPVWRASAATHGQRQSMPMHDVLIHVCTHAQYTGAQCVNMLRRLRVDPLPHITFSSLSRGGFTAH